MNKTIELTANDKIKITLTGRQSKHLRINNSWTDWMLSMNDFRDMIKTIDTTHADRLFRSLINGKAYFKNKNKVWQEYSLSKGKKIVRRIGKGRLRSEYQSIALFVANSQNLWPPQPFEITISDLSKLMISMITIDRPKEYCIKDSLRNFQYLLSILWMKKVDEKLLQKNLEAKHIFRLGIP